MKKSLELTLFSYQHLQEDKIIIQTKQIKRINYKYKTKTKLHPTLTVLNYACSEMLHIETYFLYF